MENKIQVQKLTKRRLILGAIMLLVALMLILAPCFNVIKATLKIYSYRQTVESNGFDYISDFDGGDALDKFAYASSLMCLIFGILLMILVAVNTLIVGNEKMNKVNVVSNVVALVISLLYMIAGIATKADFGSGASTLAFLPFIIIALLVVVYFVCCKKIATSEDDGVINQADNAQKGKASSSVQAQKDKIALLNEYKQLLDGGIITQEEFEQKKKELL